MTKEEIIKAFGKNDGHDEFRYSIALEHSLETNVSPEEIFQNLITLEDKGMISIEDAPKSDASNSPLH